MHSWLNQKKPAIVMAHLLALVLLLALSGSSSSPVVVARGSDHGGDEYMIVAMSSLKLKSACLGHRVTPPLNSTWMPLDLMDGPCSSPSSSSAAAAPSVDELLRRDQLRADEVQKRLSHNVGDDEANGPASSTVTQVNHLAKIKVELGSRKPAKTKASQLVGIATVGGGVGTGTLLPGVIQTVVLDTASDVPWVQCVPCPIPPCHPQTDTFYDPTNSGSYAAFSCSSAACRQLGPYANGCINNQCQYRVAYPDGSSTSGTYSSDLLTLNPTTSVSNFQFGCSHADQGNFDSQTAGVMALGGGPESLISQTASTFGRTFSYCLPPTASYVGYLVLGAPAPSVASSSSYVVTPMIRDNRSPATFYRVRLRAITVAGRRIDVPAAGGAAVLDSRTVITRLPPAAYAAVRAAFRSAMMGMYRPAPPKGSLDTCYDFRGVRSVKLPRVALVFDGGVVELDPSGILFNDCLAFAANRDDRMPVILGNVQQQTIEVLYDVDGGAVGFRRNAC
ncbi:unnamed protein product [Urochloa decumbens]|uniref:Peptidase A1 domain-containing protein n=1 Tax=Urochloa decumbens TaxID=240449 RepID=A0ABC9DCB4_9POAL